MGSEREGLGFRLYCELLIASVLLGPFGVPSWVFFILGRKLMLESTRVCIYGKFRLVLRLFSIEWYILRSANHKILVALKLCVA